MDATADALDRLAELEGEGGELSREKEAALEAQKTALDAQEARLEAQRDNVLLRAQVTNHTVELPRGTVLNLRTTAEHGCGVITERPPPRFITSCPGS